MTFRNTALLFIIFLLLNSCKGLQYYKSASNPAGVSVVLKCDPTFYTNIQQSDSIAFYLVNHNSEKMSIGSWWTQLSLIGQSRFYQKEMSIKPQLNDPGSGALVLMPSDTVLLVKLAINSILNTEKIWTYKNKNIWGPHLLSVKKNYPYIYLTAEYIIKVPNQEEIIKIRSEKIKVNISQYKEQNLKSKKTELGLSSDIRTFNTQDKKGNLFCKINNIGSYPIPLFNDPGSVRFKLYAYNPNRTATMFTEYILNNGKLPVAPVNINSKENYTITIPLQQVLFSEAPQHTIYYWTWNKKSPPISPLVYGKKDLTVEVEFWFGVVVDGKEYLSNTIKIMVNSTSQKTSKK